MPMCSTSGRAHYSEKTCSINSMKESVKVTGHEGGKWYIFMSPYHLAQCCA